MKHAAIVRNIDQVAPIDCPYGTVRRIVTGGEGNGNVHVVRVTEGGAHYHQAYEETYYFRHPVHVDRRRKGVSPQTLMKIIEPHIHMIARTTQDYERMARMHTVACCEPAFWAGYDRTSAAAFHDYFTHISEFEPTRAAKYNIDHYCYICMNPKEAENLSLAREVIGFIPDFLDKPNVLGIGEIGLNKNTPNEMTIFEEQVELALQHDQLIWIHTPHLEDKYKGTKKMLDYLNGHNGVDPEKVTFDHCEEHTLRMVLDAG